MEDDSERSPAATAQLANAVAHCDPVSSTSTADRAMVDRKDDRFAGSKRHDQNPRLHARPLLGQHEFSALKFFWVAQEERCLQWKGQVAVKVLVQAIIVSSTIAQEQRRRAHLPSGVAAIDEI